MNVGYDLSPSVVPDVEVKGENAHYLLLVQGSDNTECGTCSVRMLYTYNQFNGAAAMATVSGLLSGNSSRSPGTLCFSELLLVSFCLRCMCSGVILIYDTACTLDLMFSPSGEKHSIQLRFNTVEVKGYLVDNYPPKLQFLLH